MLYSIMELHESDLCCHTWEEKVRCFFESFLCGEFRGFPDDRRISLIVPIVYYEGNARWTADFCLKDRIENAQKLPDCVPDFRYCMVNCRDYTKEELENKRDEMSLVMLMNRIQNPGDYSEFFETTKEYALAVYDSAPEDIKQVFADIVWSLLMKMNVPVEEAREAIMQLEVGGMGYLFENAEKMDIQAERQNTREARMAAEAAEKRAQKAEHEADEARHEADEAKQKADEAIKDKEYLLDTLVSELIQQGKSDGCTKEEMLAELQAKCGIDEAAAIEKIKKHWN